MHVAIESAKKREVCRERRNVAIGGVADLHRDDILRAHFQEIRCVKNERGKAAPMFTQPIAVHPYFRRTEYAVEFQEQTTSRISAVQQKMFSIPTDAAIVIITAIL